MTNHSGQGRAIDSDVIGFGHDWARAGVRRRCPRPCGGRAEQ